MKMKRLLSLLLAFLMCFVLVACQSDTDGDTTTTDRSEQTTGNIDDNTDKSKETTGKTEDTTDSSGDTTTKADDTTADSEQSPEPPEDPQISTATPLLYRVTDGNGNIVWLFGSIHLGREDYYPLPDYVLRAYNGADALAVEMDILSFEKDLNLQIKALSHLVYRDGTTIKDYIPASLYDSAVSILKSYNSYASALDYYCPAFWASTIDSLLYADLAVDANLGIDRHLINNAYDTGKEIVEIESAEFQYKMLGEFDSDVQLLLLMSAVERYECRDEVTDELEKLMDLWASGDEDEFSEYLNSGTDDIPLIYKQTYKKYNKAMITDRNINMADFAEEALSSGKEIFICVGAAHIVGEGAVADLLSQRGYTVERVVN